MALLALSACVGAPATRPTLTPNTAAALPLAGEQPLGDPRSQMIDNAMAMLGQPYKWGGAAPGGFDCSGLVVYAAAGAGIRLPRTASEQRQVGASVSLKHLKAGDLVFMHLSHKELHVGIALDSARFIHAPSTGGRVRIDSIAAAPYAKGFIGARRVIVDRVAQRE